MLIISEYNKRFKKSAGVEYLKKMEESAKLLGIEVLSFEQGNPHSLEEIIRRKGNLKENSTVYWIGFVPAYEDYVTTYEILKKHKLNLVNTPDEFAKSEYFDRFYEVIKEDSFKSGIANNLEEAKQIASELKYPLFMKGTIQSLKKFGWENCIAHNEEEVENIFNKLKKETTYSLGKIILREYVELRYKELGGNGIPKAHEYRFMLLNNQIVGYSYYWNGENPFQLESTILAKICRQAINISKKLAVPYISLDIAETSQGDWKVIEVGDGQFSDIRNLSPFKLWNFIVENK